jgi:hypothetical protein
MVRDTWDHANERQNKTWKALAQDDAIVPTLILERIIDGVLSEKGRTYVANRRESLCSSWAAAVRSLEKSPIKLAAGWSELLRRAVGGAAGSTRPDPKMLDVVEKLTKLALDGEKTVVFTQRSATGRQLQKLLHAELMSRTADFSRRSDHWR